MRGLIAGLLVLVTGCIEASLVPCGDQVCAAGWTCTADLRCATPQAVAACDGLMEGDLCGDEAEGACHSAACWPITCGDAVVDHGEVCDDGNELSFDGCSATCDSNERCGNTTVDPSEDCDEGVAGLSSDGCSSTCTFELAAWRDIDPTPIPGRNAAAIAYDEARRQVVVFGGYNGSGVLGDMWTWNGSDWRAISLGIAPAARAHAVMVYDAARAQVILFGGIGNAGALADTWAWNGATWTRLAPALSPSARGNAAATYDRDRQRIVLFGGAGDASTWEWDGTTWSEHTAPGPSPRIWSMMAYDAKRAETVLYGGLSGTNTGLVDTWTWNGTSWTQRDDTAGIPAASFGAGMAYDSTRERVVLVGGRSPAFIDVNATWDWDGVTWTDRGSAPGARYHPSVVFDGAAQRVRLFGGSTQSSYRFDTQTWTGSTWDSLIVAPTPIETRGRAAITYDARRGQVLLHGGYRTQGGATTTFNDFWIWDGGGWASRVAGAVTPRHSHTLTQDPGRDRTVLFGGLNNGNRLNDTWEWNGMSWARAQPPVSPPARNSHAATYDPVGRRILVFGGFSGSGSLDDTWSYDGTTWTQLTPTVSPPPRGGMTMVHDAARGNIVMFGGDGASLYGDTWLFDGATWTQATPAVAPTPRWLHSMYYDPIRERVVLTGGLGALITNETWEWDGTSWSERVEAPNVASWGAAIEYSAVERRSISFGGFGSITTYGTRSLVFASPFALEEQCRGADVDDDGDGLAGCDDPDCWGRCTPLCPPTRSCPADAPRCGDSVCSPVEDKLICPVDC